MDRRGTGHFALISEGLSYRFAFFIGDARLLFSVDFGSVWEAADACRLVRDRLRHGNVARSIAQDGPSSFMVLSSTGRLLARSPAFKSEAAMNEAIERCGLVAFDAPIARSKV